MKWILLLQLFTLNVVANYWQDASLFDQKVLTEKLERLQLLNINEQHLEDLKYVRISCYHKNYNRISFDDSSVRKYMEGSFSIGYLYNNKLGRDITNQRINIIDACSIHDRYNHHVIRILQDSIEKKDIINTYSIIGFYIRRAIHNKKQFLNVDLSKVFSELVKAYDVFSEDYLRNNIIWTAGQLHHLSPKNNLFWTLNIPKCQKLQCTWFAKSAITYNTYFNNPKQYLEKVKNDLFPNKHNCINYHIRASDDILRETDKGIKEAVTAFKSVFKELKQIENGKVNIYVFRDKQQYDNYGALLFDISTNNGGIYLDGSDSIFTFYSRPNSSYSFKHLLLHEVFHYLVESYLLKGEWAYKRSKVPYDEGIAEFLVSLVEGDGMLSKDKVDDSILTKDYNYTRLYPESGKYFKDLYKNKELFDEAIMDYIIINN